MGSCENRPALLVLDTLARHLRRTRSCGCKCANSSICCAGSRCLTAAQCRLAHPSLAGMEKGHPDPPAGNNSFDRDSISIEHLPGRDRARSRCAGASKSASLNYGRTDLEIPMRWKSGCLCPGRGTSSGGDRLQTKQERSGISRMLGRLFGPRNERQCEQIPDLRSGSICQGSESKRRAIKIIRGGDESIIRQWKQIENVPFGSLTPTL